MDEITQRDVWLWLHDHGPASIDGITDGIEAAVRCGECDRPHGEADREAIAAATRALHTSGHVTATVDRRWRANPTDELRPLCEPFGAGAGDVISGDLPPDEPGESR